VRTAIIFGLIVLSIIALFFAITHFSPGEPVQTAEVVAGPIREFVDERGKTTIPQTYLVSMPFAGRVDEIRWKEGDSVAKGELVAQVSTVDLANELAQAEASVQRLQASIKENEFNQVELGMKRQAEYYVESMEQTVEASKKETETAKKKYSFAESRFARMTAIPGISVDDKDQAEVQMIDSEAEYFKSNRYWKAAQSLNAATSLSPAIIQYYIDRKQLGAEVIRQELAEAEVRLARAKIDSSRGSMKSPIDGIVLEKQAENEQFLTAGAELLTLGSLAELEVEAEILSEDVVDIEIGDPVEVYGPATGAAIGSGYQATVSRIYPTAFTKRSSLGVEQQRVIVVVRFTPEERQRLRAAREINVNYRVRVRIFTDEKEKTLVVPRSALFRSATGGWQVFVVKAGVAELIDVEVGLTNDQHAEIVSGLDEGDRVILAPESTLESGAKVDAR